MKLVLACLLALASVAARAVTWTGPLAVANQPSTAPAAGQPNYVWMTDSLQKIPQYGATVGPNQGILLFGAENEIVSFQTHIKAPAGGFPNLSVSLSSLTLVTAPNTVISSVAYGYGINPSSPTWQIITYAEKYITITTVTATAAAFYNNNGNWPDVLVPFVDPYWNQATNASSIAVTVSTTQSYWFDIHIPTTAPSGYYYGSEYISSGTIVISTLPVVLGVIGWVMPSTATLPIYNGAGYGALCGEQYGAPGGDMAAGCTYPGASNDATADQVTSADLLAFMLDHRLASTLNSQQTDSSFTTYEAQAGALLNGTNYPRFNTILSGAKPAMAQYSPSTYGTTSASNWGTEYVNKGWNTNSAKPFNYTCDELNCTGAQYISSATLMHAASPPMTTLWTTSLTQANTNGVQNYIDIIVPPINIGEPIGGTNTYPSYQVWLSTAQSARAQVWSYLACGSAGTCTNNTIGGPTWNFPNYDIDALPLANRAMEWMSFMHKQTGELYYDLTYCWNPFNGSLCGNSVYTVPENPWINNYTFGNNGDGTLIYPGLVQKGVVTSTNPAVVFPGGTGTPIYLASIRLDEQRDGVQDFEYMNALTKLGGASGAATVAAATTSWISNSYTYNLSTAATGSYTSDLADARLTMAAAIQALVYPPGPTITSALTAFGFLGSPFTYTITGTGSPTSYSATGLPNGLSVNTATGVISGTPTAGGTTSVTIGATNALGTGTATLVITVNSGSVLIH